MAFRCKFNDESGLPAAALQAYQCDGVFIVEDFVAPAACDALRQRAIELVERHGPTAPGTVFSTQDQRHARDRYFEQSAASTGVFFEEEAFDTSGKLQVPLTCAVNKIGHGMHDIDPVFRAFSHGPRLQAVADATGLIYPKLIQSMYIFKQPGIGGEVVCHQDSTFLFTTPPSVVGFWFAIEDAHRGNGCLGGLPGEHVKGLKDIYRRQADGSLKLEPFQTDIVWDMERLEWLEVSKGTLIVFNGMFPHLSLPNRSAQSRHAYTLHAVSGAAAYPRENWLQRGPGDPPFAGFM